MPAMASFTRRRASLRPFIEAACWSHARRKFFELATLKKAPIAIEAVRRIDELFAIEREINGLSAAARLAERQKRSAPLVENLKTWLTEERAKLSSKNPVAKAIDYSLKRWPAMTLFLTDGRVCLSNNAAERALRGIAVGRHNWTFAGSDRGGERAAAIYTLIETCKHERRRSPSLARRCPQTPSRPPSQPHRRPPAMELEKTSRPRTRRLNCSYPGSSADAYCPSRVFQQPVLAVSSEVFQRPAKAEIFSSSRGQVCHSLLLDVERIHAHIIRGHRCVDDHETVLNRARNFAVSNPLRNRIR